MTAKQAKVRVNQKKSKRISASTSLTSPTWH